MTPIDEVVLVGSQSFAMMNGYRLSKGVFFDARKTDKGDSTSCAEFSVLKISVHVRRKVSATVDH